jgi:hypothetical protein
VGLRFLSGLAQARGPSRITLWVNDWPFVENALGKVVYPPVAKESVRNDKEIKGIGSVPSEADGDEGATSD